MPSPEHYVFYSFVTLIMFCTTLLLGLSIDKFINEIIGTFDRRLNSIIDEKVEMLNKVIADLAVEQESLINFIGEKHNESLTKRHQKVFFAINSGAAKAKEMQKELAQKSGNLLSQELRPCVEVAMLAALLGFIFIVIGGIEHAGYLFGYYFFYIFSFTLIALWLFIYFIKKTRVSNHTENSKFEIFGRAATILGYIVVLTAITFAIYQIVGFFDVIAWLITSYPNVAKVALTVLAVGSFPLLATLTGFSILITPLILIGLKLKNHHKSMQASAKSILEDKALLKAEEEEVELSLAIGKLTDANGVLEILSNESQEEEEGDPAATT
ncbi:MAG: hypothetical protein Q8O20_04445 [Sulfuricurvum sp.]|uniref:hypothetical protein n=1 Tax=Sulfuricurvum sp. TaxID=2025608 RepID=UPI0027358B47|nr:hypothetical protein [Sulfuricurvum sp.]MDP2850302.1 hypothetical protein [Sulfuricurvum sp.]